MAQIPGLGPKKQFDHWGQKNSGLSIAGFDDHENDFRDHDYELSSRAGPFHGS